MSGKLGKTVTKKTDQMIGKLIRKTVENESDQAIGKLVRKAATHKLKSMVKGQK